MLFCADGPVTFSALLFPRVLKIKLERYIDIFAYIFLLLFLYKGFIIEYFNLFGKIPLVITLLHIQGVPGGM